MADRKAESSPPRIGIVARGEVRIAGLTAVLAELGEPEIVWMAHPGAAQTSGLDVVLIDASTTTHVVELLASFRKVRPKLRLIVLSDQSDFEYVSGMISAGARGVLSHGATESELRMAIDVVRDGSVWAPRKVLSRLLDKADTAAGGVSEVRLTAREVDVLRLLTLGLANREIALALSVKPPAIKAHLTRLMRKAQVENRTALSVHAIASKWV